MCRLWIMQWEALPLGYGSLQQQHSCRIFYSTVKAPK
jgi:hypothetical protein